MKIDLLETFRKIFSKSDMIKKGILSLIGTFLIKAVNLISIPVFSRLLSTGEYGDVNIFMTYVSIFVILLGLDFHGAVSRGCLDFKDSKNQFLSVGVACTGFYTFIIICFVNLFHSFFCQLFSIGWFQLNVLLLYSYASFLVSYMSAEYIFYFNYKMNTLLSMVVALSNFGLSVLLIETLFKDNRFLGRILGASIPTILIAAIVFVYLLYRGRTFFNRQYIFYFMKLGLPIIPHDLSHLVLSNSDKVMISSMISSGTNGIYSLVYNVGWMLAVLTEALNNVWIPWMFRKMEAGDTGLLKKAFSIYMAGFAVITICLEAFSPEIVMLISPSGYWDGIRIVIWIVFSSFLSFMYVLYVNLEFYEKKTFLIPIGTVMAAAINIILNVFFLKKYGYEFAAISTVLSYFALVVFHMCIVVFVLRKKIIHSGLFIFFIAFVLGISLLFQVFLDKLLVRILVMAVSVFLVGFGSLVSLRKLKDINKY